MAHLDARILRRLLFDYLKPTSFEGDNPYLVTINEGKYWIYIKNLSPAYFKNPDVWRAQLPIREIFSTCKASSYPFILLGYDDDNDVYTTWNPNFTKQRLNEAESVSFYSRLSLQQEASESQELLEMTLQNNMKVICFPRSQIVDVINSIDSFFAEDANEYVAIGSKRRTDANTAFRDFTDASNIELFASYLQNNSNYSDRTIHTYSQAIKRLINKGFFGKYRVLFLKYDSISEYYSVYDPFFANDDVHLINEKSKKVYSNAFMRYIDFLCAKNGIAASSDNVSETDSITTEENTSIDWESKFTDNNGKLTKIANPELLEKLRPILTGDFPSRTSALNIIDDFYKGRFENMDFKDWSNLIDDIQWNLPNYGISHSSQIVNTGKEGEGENKTKFAKKVQETKSK